MQSWWAAKLLSPDGPVGEKEIVEWIFTPSLEPLTLHEISHLFDTRTLAREPHFLSHFDLALEARVTHTRHHRLSGGLSRWVRPRTKFLSPRPINIAVSWHTTKHCRSLVMKGQETLGTRLKSRRRMGNLWSAFAWCQTGLTLWKSPPALIVPLVMGKGTGHSVNSMLPVGGTQR